jgi:hypothetical protein
VKTTQQIAIKRQELNHLRHAISDTLGPPRSHTGLGWGLVCAGFAMGVMVERWGWRPLARSAMTVNHWAGLAGSVVGPTLAFLNS